MKSENVFLKKNTGNLMKNVIRLLLFKEGMELEHLSKLMGVDKDSLKEFLGVLIKKGAITEKGKKYFWKK